ncbi:MAG: hypothetical protein F6K30_10540 [Cyanothece sp. SIO2G6]|nr:hypothetical protein [Cyanothece sp. SIO2G6]
MSTSSPSPQSNSESDSQANAEREALQRDILQGRKFSLADVIGREGGSFMKGESPVPKLVQAKLEINQFISEQLPDPSGALQSVLHRWVEDDTARVSRHLDIPLKALADLLESIVNQPSILYELVRHVDMKWGQMNDERPYFQQPQQRPHPDDEYTHESVRHQLQGLLATVKAAL